MSTTSNLLNFELLSFQVEKKPKQNKKMQNIKFKS